MDIWVIIPGYNEEKYLATVLQSAKKITSKIIYVDDGSHDRSVAIARKHLKHVVVHEVNLGKGAALKTGCEYAFTTLQADAVVFMDSDNQHDPQELKRFFAHLEEGARLVYGVRRMGTDMPLFRFLGNKFASVMLSILFGKYVPDIPSGYKAMTKKTYRQIQWRSSGYEVEIEIAARAARQDIPFKIVDIEAIYHDTEKGMTALDALHVAWFLLQLRLE